MERGLAQVDNELGLKNPCPYGVVRKTKTNDLQADTLCERKQRERRPENEEKRLAGSLSAFITSVNGGVVADERHRR